MGEVAAGGGKVREGSTGSWNAGPTSRTLKGSSPALRSPDVVRLTSKSQQGERGALSGSGVASSSEGGGVVSGTMCVEQRRILETVTVCMTPFKTVDVEDIVINLQLVHCLFLCMWETDISYWRMSVVCPSYVWWETDI